MHALQSGLPSAYRNDEIFKNKLLNAVKDVESCRFAYFKPADTVEGLISDLHSSLAIEPSSITSPDVDAHFIDRRFKGQRGRIPNYKGSNRQDLSCIVCHKKGCWSTNHSKKERIDALRKNRQVRQFLTTVSDSDDGDAAPADEVEDNRDIDDAHLEELEELAGPALVVQIDVDTDECDEDEQPTCYFAKADDEDNTTDYIASARDASVSHALTATFKNDSRYNDEFFYGVMIDTGSARASSGGLPQYRAYCRHIGHAENIDTSKTVYCKFGISGKQSVGRARVKFPINGIVLEFSLHVIEDNVPILLSLADMDRLGIYFNNLTNRLIHCASKESTFVQRAYGHPFIR